MDKITPYNSKENKKKQVTKMFDNIAQSYDLLNRTLSFGIDSFWRKKAVQQIPNNAKEILDIATGTADLAISAAKYTNSKITGIDISKEMLKKGKEKIERKKLKNKITLHLGDAEKLNFNNSMFDAVTVGFGVRNFENLEQGLKEIYRVLKEKGPLIIIEPSIPKTTIFKECYNLYFKYIVPKIGSFISKDNNAYTYLPNSVEAFPPMNEFIMILKNIGFRKIKHKSLSLGIVSIYIAIK